MKTGFRGTFVIAWAQTELDGQWSGRIDDLVAGAAWMWTGEAVRVDGPSEVLPLGDAAGEADLRRRAALTLRRLRGGAPAAPPVALRGPLFSSTFTVTDGLQTWDVVLIGMGPGRKPLLMFRAAIPPRDTELWVVRENIAAALRRAPGQDPGGVICFTPGTLIDTPRGPRDVAALMEGDLVQTKDNGAAEILWIGRRDVSGARMRALPALRPVRLRAGALDRDVPDGGLLVSPDHRVVLRGARARALFNADEVLVAASDLVNDCSVFRDHSLARVTYVHMLLPQHEIVFANGVATESFHPASAALASMAVTERVRLLDRMPELAGNPLAYGAYARRMLSRSDAAVLRSDVIGRR